MAAKVTFDPTTRLIKPSISPGSNRIITLNIQTDLYSDGKEDWLADPTLHKFRFPVQAIGGQVVSAGKLGTTYLLTDGWRIDPNLNEVIQAGVTQDSSEEIFGAGGANETVHQEIQLDHPSQVNRLWVTIRKVGDPADNLRLRLHDPNFVDYGSVEIDAHQIGTSFAEIFAAFEDQEVVPSTETVFIHFERTGSRDEVNYFEVAVDTSNPYTGGEALAKNSGVYSPVGGDLVIRFQMVVPYQLQLTGNIFTDTGVPVALSADNVNVQQTVSTLVELKELYEQALEDIRKVMLNSFLTDPNTGKMIVYDDDGVTEAFSADIWEDVAKSQPYRGRGIERRDAFEDGAGDSA